MSLCILGHVDRCIHQLSLEAKLLKRVQAFKALTDTEQGEGSVAIEKELALFQ